MSWGLARRHGRCFRAKGKDGSLSFLRGPLLPPLTRGIAAQFSSPVYQALPHKNVDYQAQRTTCARQAHARAQRWQAPYTTEPTAAAMAAALHGTRRCARKCGHPNGADKTMPARQVFSRAAEAPYSRSVHFARLPFQRTRRPLRGRKRSARRWRRGPEPEEGVSTTLGGGHSAAPLNRGALGINARV